MKTMGNVLLTICVFGFYFTIFAILPSPGCRGREPFPKSLPEEQMRKANSEPLPKQVWPNDLTGRGMNPF